jgi:hypothetical protein
LSLLGASWEQSGGPRLRRLSGPLVRVAGGRRPGCLVLVWRGSMMICARCAMIRSATSTIDVAVAQGSARLSKVMQSTGRSLESLSQRSGTRSHCFSMGFLSCRILCHLLPFWKDGAVVGALMASSSLARSSLMALCIWVAGKGVRELDGQLWLLMRRERSLVEHMALVLTTFHPRSGLSCGECYRHSGMQCHPSRFS